MTFYSYDFGIHLVSGGGWFHLGNEFLIDLKGGLVLVAGVVRWFGPHFGLFGHSLASGPF